MFRIQFSAWPANLDFSKPIRLGRQSGQYDAIIDQKYRKNVNPCTDPIDEKNEATEEGKSINPKILPLLRIIQCDGYIVYPSWSKDKAWVKLMGCHSHVRRKFFEATEQSPRLVAWILRQIAHLYHIEKRLRETKAGPALRESVRAAESRMIHRRLKKAIDKLALRRSILPKSKLGKAISYAINQWSNLETYLGDGRVEICNNLVENGPRNFFSVKSSD
jgi:hypothetical protein